MWRLFFFCQVLLSMVAEGRDDRESLGERATERVNEDVDLRILVLAKDVVHIVRVEIPSSDVALQVKLIIVLGHKKAYICGFDAANVRVIYYMRKDRRIILEWTNIMQIH